MESDPKVGIKSRKPWKNLGSRFVTAVIMSIICAIPLYFGGFVWALFCIFLGTRMLYEWVRMSDPHSGVLDMMIPFLGLLISVIYLITGHSYLAALTVGLTAVISYFTKIPKKGSFWSPFGCLYILVPILLIIWLRGTEVGLKSEGFQHLLFFILVVVAADTFAYFGGSYFKGPKMAPVLSPNKSWSGFFCGIVGACLIGAFAGHSFGFGWAFGTILAAPIAVVSVFGDFLESGLKRKLGVKDAGELLPGHGGLLDRLDSLMMVVFVFAILTLLIPGFWGLGA